MPKRKPAPRPSAAPLYLLRLPSLLSARDLARLALHTKDISFSTAFEDRHVGHVGRFIWRPPSTRSKSTATGAGRGAKVSSDTCDLSDLVASPDLDDDDLDDDLDDDFDDSDEDDEDFDPSDPDPCSCYASAECPQWLFRKLKVAVRKGASKWPSALPDYSSGGVRYENIHGMCYGVGDRKSWHLDAFPKSKRPRGPPSYEDARALSVVVCLVPCEAGGDFEVVRGSAPLTLATGEPVGRPEAIPLSAGDAIVFPSKRLMHQVAAVTCGQRKSLAIFARTPAQGPQRSAYDSDDDLDDD